MVILFILSYFLSNDKILSNMIGFAGTIVSIVLAVIAIILTLTESSKTTRANEQILDSSNIITNSANSLNSIVNDLNNLNISEEITNLKSYISSLLTSMEESVVTRVGIVLDNNYLISSSSDIPNISSEESGIINKKEFIKYLFNNFRGQYITNIKYFIYFIYRLYKEEKVLNYVYDLIDILYIKDTENGNTYKNVYNGFINIFLIFHLFEINVLEDSMPIIEFDNDFEEFINELIIQDNNIKNFVDINYNNILHTSSPGT